jgi:hypothetical protein
MTSKKIKKGAYWALPVKIKKYIRPTQDDTKLVLIKPAKNRQKTGTGLNPAAE